MITAGLIREPNDFSFLAERLSKRALLRHLDGHGLLSVADTLPRPEPGDGVPRGLPGGVRRGRRVHTAADRGEQTHALY